MSDIVSKPYQPNPDVCCEACVFKRGAHAAWCKWWRCPKCGRVVDRTSCPEFPGAHQCGPERKSRGRRAPRQQG